MGGAGYCSLIPMHASAHAHKHIAVVECAMDQLSLPSCVRGHHIYKRAWTPVTGEVLSCERETGNTEYRYAVAMLRRGAVVGHVPK